MPRSKRFRLGRRIAVVAVAVAVLGTTYRLTRPPELVWWRSPLLGRTGLHVRVLVPAGWESSQVDGIKPDMAGGLPVAYSLNPVDRMPIFLHRILPLRHEKTVQLSISVYEGEPNMVEPTPTEVNYYDIGKFYQSNRIALSGTARIWATLGYQRTDQAAFNRTYKQICNSLTIE